ncbi:MAG: glycosyltransferase [Verrucomicrobiota bacterium]
MTDLAVLITAYNDHVGLDMVLRSIEEEDNSFTVLIVDDGSDSPIEIDREEFSFKIEVISLAVNQGTAKAANVGLKWIRENGYRFVARLDAGDLQVRNRLGIQYDYLNRSEELVLVGSNAIFRDEITGDVLFETDLPREWEEIKKWSVFRTCFIHPTVMLRLDRLEDSYEYSTKYPYIDDYDFVTRIAMNYPSAVLAAPLLHCFVREAGLSRTHDREQLVAGIRHHLDHPEWFNHLWYGYIAKRLIYLLVPFRSRVGVKGLLKMVKRPAEKNISDGTASHSIPPQISKTKRTKTHVHLN